MGAILDLIRAPRTTPKAVPQSTSVVAYTYDGKVGKADARLYRHWAIHSEWIRGAINIRRSQVSSAEWDIVPFDKNRPVSTRLQKRLRSQFMRPNPANDSFRSFVEPIVEDIITLDAGVIEKVRTMTGDLVEMWPVDGATIKVNANWDGNPDEPRYYWYPDYKERASFLNSEMLYMMANPRTNSPVGLSGLETLKSVIEAELYGHRYNHRQVAGAAPDGVLDLGEGMTEPDVKKFRSYFESEVAGRGAVGFIGGSKGAKWIPFRATNRDMQFLEWQIYLVRKIAVVLGLTPQDLGVTFDINRSTSETQIQISEDRGLRPLMTLLQDYFTEEIVWDRAFGGPDNNLCFRFTALNLKESTAKAAINEKALSGVPWRYVNEARLDEGREPIAELEGKIIMATPIGAVDISDVPTVREIIEMQTAAKKPDAPPPPKGAEINVAAPDLSPVTAAVQALAEAQGNSDQKFIEAIARAVEPQPIYINNAPPASGEAKAEPVAPRDRTVARETEFITDETGRIIGKREVETVANEAEAKAIEAEIERRRLELKLAEDARAALQARKVVRKTEFVTDEHGRIIGKTEKEIDDAR